MGFSKVSFSDCVPLHHGATQKPEATQADPVPFFSLFCPKSLFPIFFFYWEKRKFGEFQHQLDLEEQEGSLLVLMLLLAAILSENMSFLGNQVQLYLRQQISRVGKAYTVTTHR